MANNIIKKLESFKIPEVDKLVNELFSTDNYEERVEFCECIIDALLFNDIDVDDLEDSIKELALN